MRYEIDDNLGEYRGEIYSIIDTQRKEEFTCIVKGKRLYVVCQCANENDLHTVLNALNQWEKE